MPDTPPAANLTANQLFLTFVRIGSMAWGGGASTLAMMHAEFVSRKYAHDLAHVDPLFN